MTKKIADIRHIKATLKKFRHLIRKKYKAEITGVFGSYSRGEQKEGSDLDVLVKFHEGAMLFDFIDLADYLEDELDIKVDVVSERAVRPEIKEEIYRDVIRL